MNIFFEVNTPFAQKVLINTVEGPLTLEFFSIFAAVYRNLKLRLKQILWLETELLQ